ncbi:hypothetical protein K1719_007888 [Acacia pycnantha]|nr:hypothetical protein K1719_007888 [Acacia pycnantha]
MATHLPDHFKCPISLEIMSDPVIIPSGHTFDRSSIQRWLNAGHRVCPITKLPLPDYPSLIPNHALRSLISNYALISPLQQQLPPHPETLVSLLTSRSSPLESKVELLGQLIRLSQRDSLFRRRLTESGVVSAVLNCVDSGVIARVVAVLLGGSPNCRAIAATMLTSLAVVEVNKATIGAYPCAIETLVSLLRNGKGREKKEAATALYAICSFPDNRRRAVECGAVPVLLGNADSGLERAVEVLGILAKCKEGREQMKSYHGCIQILALVLRNGSSRGIQYALLALNSLCCSSEKMRLEAVKEGVLEIGLQLLDDDSEKVRRNSSNLIQVLRGNQWTS